MIDSKCVGCNAHWHDGPHDYRCASCGQFEFSRSWRTPDGSYSTFRRYRIPSGFAYKVSSGWILDGIEERIRVLTDHLRENPQDNPQNLLALRKAYLLLTKVLGE